MKILLISKSDDGGAGRAAYRLHQGLKLLGADSQMRVQLKSSDDKKVLEPETFLGKLSARLKLIERLDAWPLKLYPQRQCKDFSLQWFPHQMLSKATLEDADIINLHWACHGYMSIEKLAKLNKPIVWTLHDMWAFTGGCHYTQDCLGYQESCGACPQLQSQKNQDLSRWVWQRKAKAWKKLNLTVVTPSQWLAECAKASSLFNDLRVEVIPHGMDIQKFKPIERSIARKILNLPLDKRIVLFGAIYSNEERKGYQLLQPALQGLKPSELRQEIELVIFGGSQSKTSVDLGFKCHYLGRFYDDIALAVLYSAADVMVVPSLQESFGQTAFEALACGTPVVAFNATGLKDIVEHQKNGYLAKPYEIDDLARGIAWVLEDKDRHKNLCFSAREKAEKEYRLELQANRYLSLFSQINNRD